MENKGKRVRLTLRMPVRLHKILRKVVRDRHMNESICRLVAVGLVSLAEKAEGGQTNGPKQAEQ